MDAAGVTILTDSQALVKALKTHEVDSQCINSLRESLNKIGDSKRIKVNWIKAHIGHAGNELADELEGSETAPRSWLEPAIKSYPLS